MLRGGARRGSWGCAWATRSPCARSGAERRLELLAGTLEPADANTRRAIADLLVMDIAAAQELLGRVGRLDRIDLIVPEGAAGRRLLARRRARCCRPGAQILPAARRAPGPPRR